MSCKPVQCEHEWLEGRDDGRYLRRCIKCGWVAFGREESEESKQQGYTIDFGGV